MVLEEVKGESRSSKRLPWLSDGDSSPADSVRQGMTTNLSVPQPAETEAVILFGLFGSTSCWMCLTIACLEMESSFGGTVLGRYLRRLLVLYGR